MYSMYSHLFSLMWILIRFIGSIEKKKNGGNQKTGKKSSTAFEKKTPQGINKHLFLIYQVDVMHNCASIKY